MQLPCEYCVAVGTLDCAGSLKYTSKARVATAVRSKATEVRVWARPMKPIRSPKNGSEIATNAAEAPERCTTNTATWHGIVRVHISKTVLRACSLVRQPSPVKTQYNERYTSLTGSVPLMPRCNSTVSTISARHDADGLTVEVLRQT